MTENPLPLSIYIHFPWCIKKCPYCDFNSHTLKEDFSEEHYIDCLIKDFHFELQGEFSNLIKHSEVISIFMGGGTPSLFSGKALKRLLETISNEVNFSKEIEITLEANPGTVEHDPFENYLQAGINRLSLGVQSFDDAQLKTLGRVHSADGAHRAITLAQQAGFNNINLDLMYALPNQSVQQAFSDCQTAILHQTNHLSFYQLTLEPNTYFHLHPPVLPKEEQIEDIQHALQEKLQANGYLQYEISAYCQKSFQSIHNQNYWQFGDYLGIGAGAHSKLTHNGDIFRVWKQKQPKNYMAQVVAEKQYRFKNRVKQQDIDFEFLMNALRLKNGFSFSTYKTTTGRSVELLLCLLQPFVEQQLIQVIDHQINCTPRGYDFLDTVLEKLLDTNTA